MDCGNVTRVSWSEVRSRVRHLNGRLAAAIDAVAGASPEQTLLAVQYPYGARIASDGRLATPCDESAAEGECTCCSDLRADIERAGAASALPVSLLLENFAEVYTEHADKALRDEKRVIPLNLLRPGDLFGVFETSDRLINRPPWSLWKVSSGARSVRILANLTSDKHKQQIDRALGTQGARATQGDWALIAHVNSHEADPWKTTVLVLPTPWLNQPKSGALKEFVLAVAWEQSEGLRKQTFEHFVAPRVVLNCKQVDQRYYHATLRHLVAVAEGSMPAFTPVVRGGYEAGPFLAFQRFILEENIGENIQRSPAYFPALLQPTLLRTSGAVGYYSVTCPTLLYPFHGPAPVKRAKIDFLEGVQSGLRGFVRDDDVLDYWKTRFIALDAKGGPVKMKTAEAERMLGLIRDDFRSAVDTTRPLHLNNLFLQRAVRVARK